MKKNFKKLSIALMSLSVISLTSCSEEEPADVAGCMDSAANNYNSEATPDDGSCTYDPTNSDHLTADTWYFEDASSSDAQVTTEINTFLAGGHFNFHADMTFDGLFPVPQDTLSGTWAFNNDETMLYIYEDQDTTEFQVNLLNDSNLSFIMDMEMDSAQYIPVTMNWDHVQ